MASEFPPIMNAEQAMKFLQCGHKTLTRLRQEGKIAARWAGKGYKYSKSSIQKYIDSGYEVPEEGKAS